jgi:hypothetical protein
VSPWTTPSRLLRGREANRPALMRRKAGSERIRYRMTKCKGRLEFGQSRAPAGAAPGVRRATESPIVHSTWQRPAAASPNFIHSTITRWDRTSVRKCARTHSVAKRYGFCIVQREKSYFGAGSRRSGGGRRGARARTDTVPPNELGAILRSMIRSANARAGQRAAQAERAGRALQTVQRDFGSSGTLLFECAPGEAAERKAGVRGRALAPLRHFCHASVRSRALRREVSHAQHACSSAGMLLERSATSQHAAARAGPKQAGSVLQKKRPRGALRAKERLVRRVSSG